MKRIAGIFFILAAVVISFQGCSYPPVDMEDSSWTTFEVRPMPFDEAWNKSVEAILQKGYMFELLSRDDGYLKTEWQREYLAASNVEVRSRVVVKFTYGNRTVRMKIEEQYLSSDGTWQFGLRAYGITVPRIEDLKQDLRDRLL